MAIAPPPPQVSPAPSTGKPRPSVKCPKMTRPLLPADPSPSVAGHMMYPGSHTVMYATSSPSLADGLTVLNTFPPTGQSHDPGTAVSHTGRCPSPLIGWLG